MARFKVPDYRQKLMLPVVLEEQLVPGSLEFAIHHLLEDRVEDSWFDDLYRNDDTGRPAYSPKMLLKIILLGYSRGLLSSRRLEQACRENVTFMAICGGERPDHSTIASFVGKLDGRISAVFCEVLLTCHEEGLLGGTHFSLDGIKLAANASRENSGTFSDLRNKLKKIETKLAEKIAAHRKSDRKEMRGGRSKRSADHAQEQRERQRQEQSLDRLRRKSDKLRDFLAENTPKQGSRGEVQSNVTDNESCRMHTNHGPIQGYNAQALVDSQHQVIVHSEAMGAGQDFRHVGPLLEGAMENLVQAGIDQEVSLKGAELTADCNYHSEENLAAAEQAGVDAYIPDPQFRSRDPRFADRLERKQQAKAETGKAQRLTLAHFSYDAPSDTYRCPAGKTLTLEAAQARDQRGNQYRRYVAQAEDCKQCPLRAQCLQRDGQRRSLHIPIGSDPNHSLTRAMRAKIDRPESRAIYARRSAVVEPVFANLRTQKRMDHFTYRGKAKVNTQWMLYCLVHNIERVARYGTKWIEKALQRAWDGAKRASRRLLSTLCKLRALFLTLRATSTPPAALTPLLAF